MKKLILLLSILSGIQLLSQAQPCTPDSAIGTAMMYPEKLPFAKVGIYYQQPLTFRVPKDSVINYNGFPVLATVDSARLVFMGGVPAGFNYQCTPTNCTWLGGTLGCATFYGKNDDTLAAGEYPIKMYVQSWIKAAGTDIVRIDSSSSYTFKVLAFNGGFELTKTEPLKVYPNPTSNELFIEMRNIRSDNNLLDISDLTGRSIFHKVIDKPQSFLTEEKIDMSIFPSGLYIVRLKTEEKVYTGKVQVR